MTLISFVLNDCFTLPSLPGLVWARLEQVYIWPDLDLRWPSQMAFLMILPHNQVYPYQVWARSEQGENVTDFDLRWPWPIFLLMFFAYSLLIHVYFQLLTQSEQVEISPDFDLGWLWPVFFLVDTPIILRFISPSFSPIGPNLKLTWPLTLVPDHESLETPVLRPSYTHPSNFRSLGPVSN